MPDPQTFPAPQYPDPTDRLLFALQAAGIGSWDLDPIDQQVWWDDRCKRLHGLQEAEPVSYERVIDCVHPDDRPMVRAAVDWALNPASQGHYDQQFRIGSGPDEQVRWLRSRGTAYFDADGVAYRFSGIVQDDTLLMQARQQLDVSEARFTDLVSALPVGTAIFTGRDMCIQQANTPMLMIWNKDARVIGKTLPVAIPELDGQPFMAQLQHVFDTGEPFQHAEGMAEVMEQGQRKQVWFNHAYNPLYDKNGQIYGVINTAVDITAQVLARRQVVASEARLRALISSAPAGIGLFVGRELIVELPNQTFIDIVGKGPDIAGKPLREVMPELLTENQPFLQILDDVYTSGTMFQSYGAPVSIMQHGVMTRNYYNITYTPMRDEQGEVFAILDIAIDVTDEIRLRQEVQKTQQVLQQAVDLAQLATWQFDVASDMMHYSERMGIWFGPGDQTTLTGFFAAVAPVDREMVEAAFKTACDPKSGGRFSAVYMFVNGKTGQYRLLHSVGQVEFDAAGKPLRLAGVSRDITTERELQLALRQEVQLRTEELSAVNEELSATNEELISSNEEYAFVNVELEESNDLLSRSNENLQTFAYIASHDLQEPLRKIQQFGDLLKTRYADPASDEFGYLERIQLAASRMSTLIRDLLRFSRISTQRNIDEPVSLGEVIDSVVSVLDMVVAETDAQLTVDTLPTITGDAAQLGQLFQNLLANALKFRRAGVSPQIHVSARTVDVDQLPTNVKPARRSDRYVCIDVADNGIGFDERYLDRIFQVFQRLHRRNDFSGTGIGLAICEKVATNHGGAISARSQPGEGATFSVYLPVRSIG